MDPTQYIQLPDGTYATLVRSMSYGDVTTILLLVAIVVLQVYAIWSRHDAMHFVTVVAGKSDDSDDPEGAKDAEPATPWIQQLRGARK